MPLYDFQCDKCNKVTEEFMKVSEYQEPICCEQKMKRLFGSTSVMPDIEPYVSMIDGSIINSRSKHREHLKQHGCIEIGNDSSLYRKPKPIETPPGLKETLIRVANEKLRG